MRPAPSDLEGRAQRLTLVPAAGTRPALDARPMMHGRVAVLAAADLLALAVALLAMREAAELIGPPAFIAPTGVLAALAVLAPLGWLAIFGAYRLYDGQTRAIAPKSFDEVATLFHALLAGSLLYLVIGQAFKRLAEWSVYTPVEAALFLVFALLAVPVARSVARAWILPRLLRPRTTLIVGAGEVARLVDRKLGLHPEYGLRVVGFIDDDGRGDGVIGRTEDLTRLVDELAIDWVVLTPTSAPHERLMEMVRAVRRPDVHMSIVPNYFELFASNAGIEDLDGVPVVSLPPMRFSRSVRVVKRTFDLVTAGLGLLVLSPLLAACAVAIKLDSKGPVFFKQLRQGRGGREFRIVKFRTMAEDAEERRHALVHLNEMGGGPLFKLRADPRVTRVGAFLRRTSLDELPQLWNVVRGEMSLVGPRPFVVQESQQITGWASRRLDTTPGITGLWQVLGRNDIPFAEMVKLDYVYVTNWSLWWDVKILFRTIPTVLSKRGAY